MVLRITRWLEANEARRTWIFSILCAFLLCARFHQGLLHAELWGEEGWVFYQDAYNDGIRCLLWPDLGYLNTVQRLWALASVWTHVPLLWLPTLFAIIGLSVQLTVAAFVIGNRLAPIWKSWKARSAFALLYVTLPNSFETFGNLTNSQWHLALLAFLITVSPPASSVRWRIFDCIVLALSSVSGPFSIVTVPSCFASLWHYRRDVHGRGELLTKTLLVCSGALVQSFFIMHGHRNPQLGLGASMLLLARIISLKVVMGLLFGMRCLRFVERMGWWHAAWPPVLIAIAGLFICVIAFLRAGYLFRTFSIFVAMLTAAELASPAVSATMQQWPAMMIPMAGQRYFLAPMLALLGALFILAGQTSRVPRLTAMILLGFVVCWAVPIDFIYVHQVVTNYDAKAREFDTAPPGTRVILPEHPYGSTFTLVKKPH